MSIASVSVIYTSIYKNPSVSFFTVFITRLIVSSSAIDGEFAPRPLRCLTVSHSVIFLNRQIFISSSTCF